MSEAADRDAIEVDLLVEAVYRHYGFDFRHYSRASLKRRLLRLVQEEGLKTLSGLQEKVLHDPACLQRLLLTLSINVTSMFRDPAFYVSLREEVVPLLRTYPSVRVWVAGCSTGEELYSIAILLEEEGIYERSTIYATDMNEAALARAEQAIYPLEHMRSYSENYERSAPRASFSDYYTADADHATFLASLRKNVVFSQHNLATDGSFNEFQLIVCRNVLIYFDKELQSHAVGLFRDSLCTFGMLGLGSHETLRFNAHESSFEVLDASNRIYRRVQP